MPILNISFMHISEKSEHCLNPPYLEILDIVLIVFGLVTARSIYLRSSRQLESLRSSLK